MSRRQSPNMEGSRVLRQRSMTDSFRGTRRRGGVSSSHDPKRELFGLDDLKSPLKRKEARKRKDDEEEEENIAVVCRQTGPAVQEVGGLQMTKDALHLTAPKFLIARDEEVSRMSDWLDLHLVTEKGPGAMYISGAPGTGKTAVVIHCVDKWVRQNSTTKSKADPCYKLVINCMNVNSSRQLYTQIALAAKVPPRDVNDSVDEGAIKDMTLGKLVPKTGINKTTKMLVLVLDEMDQLLDGRENSVLHTIFSWTNSPLSRLIVIGIANALDLAVKHLPLLSSPAVVVNQSPMFRTPSTSTPRTVKRTSSRCTRTPKTNIIDVEDPMMPPMTIINFTPYERADIEKILESRLTEIGSDTFDAGAIKFVAAKVAASTGDMRKALNGCKVALDSIEKQQRQVLRSTEDDGFNFTSPKKMCISRSKIGVPMVAKVFAAGKDEGPLPLQQLIILATMLKIYKTASRTRTPDVNGIKVAIPMVHFYEEYRKICAAKTFAWMDRSEITTVCNMLQDRSLITVVENSGGSSVSKAKGKFGTLNSANKTGFMFNLAAVEKILMQCDDNIKSIVGL